MKYAIIIFLFFFVACKHNHPHENQHGHSDETSHDHNHDHHSHDDDHKHHDHINGDDKDTKSFINEKTLRARPQNLAHGLIQEMIEHVGTMYPSYQPHLV